MLVILAVAGLAVAFYPTYSAFKRAKAGELDEPVKRYVPYV